MPVVPDSAYVSLETVTNLIRALANDMIYSQAGEILTDNANFILPLLNDSLEWFVNEMNNSGVMSFTQETLITPLTATPAPQSTDPATQTNISDNGYFDGVGINMGPQLQLPPSLLEPVDLWERQTGSQERFRWMHPVPGGLPSKVPSDRFGMWEWRQDGIYMPGIIQSNDIRLRFTSTLPQFVSTDDILYFRGATGALAYKTLAAYMGSKDPVAAQTAMGEATMRVGQLTNRSGQQKQTDGVTRISYGRRSRSARFFPPRNA
jgi:hypothetical protein